MPCTLSISLVSLKDLPRLLLPPGQVLKIQQNPQQDQDTEQEPLQPSCTTTLTYETKQVKNVRLQAKTKGVFNSFYCRCYGNQSCKKDEYNLFTNDWTFLCYHYSIICVGKVLETFASLLQLVLATPRLYIPLLVSIVLRKTMQVFVGILHMLPGHR